MNIRLYIFLLLCISYTSYGQEIPLQSIKGRILEKSIKTPVGAATVVLNDENHQPVIADSNGYFQFINIPVGRKAIIITRIGFKPVNLNNLLLESGKELVLNIEMEEDLAYAKEIIIKSSRNKSRPINDLA
ncbi:MAG: carboxypeptidase-like regulatory domain-containing protein, partial [Chitinophagaceae bacterium]